MMKRIIAAALSILVGAFGYTIVDKAIEDRVATLESEVVELREEVSRYHPQYSEHGTTRPSAESTTRNKVTTTHNHTMDDFVDFSQPLVIGSYLKESSDSVHKFLIRENTYGYFYYVSHNNYEPVSFMTRPIMTTQSSKTQPETVSFSNGYIVFHDETTMPVAPVAEYYINITESSAQITDITEEVSYRYSYDEDYSSVSEPISKTTTQITVLCKGYTDPALAGKRVVLSVGIDCFYDESIKEIVSNTIKPDGTFEYKVVYVATEQMNTRNQYSFNSISIK